jgi:APA family basic amino acid/polyamine antiporter
MSRGTKRSQGLSVFAAIAFAVGNMVGAGVFVLSGMVVNAAGPAAIISYLLCGIIVSFSGLSYAALASIFPEDGGGYLFAERMLGKFTGFLAGWAMYVAQPIGISFVLLGLGIYLNLLVGLSLDPRIAATAAIVLLTAINLRGLSEAGILEILLVVAKVSILALLIVVGLTHIRMTSFTPIMPYGTSSVVQGISTVFFAYLGFQVVAMMGGEIKKASRNVPLAMLASVGIVAAIYAGVIVALVSARLPSYGPKSLFDAALILLGPYGGILIALAAVMSTISSANASIIGASRITLEMASEKQIPGRFARLKNNQPINSIFLGSAISIMLVAYGNLGFIVELTNVTVLVTMLLVNASAFMLIKNKGRVPSPKTYFTIPLGALFPSRGAASCILLLVTIPPTSIAMGIAALLSGSILYALEDTTLGERTVQDIRKLLKRPSIAPPTSRRDARE